MMKKLLSTTGVALVAFALLAAPPAYAGVIFSDDFESGTLSVSNTYCANNASCAPWTVGHAPDAGDSIVASTE